MFTSSVIAVQSVGVRWRWINWIWIAIFNNFSAWPVLYILPLECVDVSISRALVCQYHMCWCFNITCIGVSVSRVLVCQYHVYWCVSIMCVGVSVSRVLVCQYHVCWCVHITIFPHDKFRHFYYCFWESLRLFRHTQRERKAISEILRL